MCLPAYTEYSTDYQQSKNYNLPFVKKAACKSYILIICQILIKLQINISLENIQNQNRLRDRKMGVSEKQCLINEKKGFRCRNQLDVEM